MQGIEILNKEPIMTLTDTGETIFIIAGIIAVISLMCATICFCTDVSVGLIISGIFVIVSVAGMFINCNVNCKPSSRYKYEAVIDDDVSINEVYKHYNVIEQDGKKWILEDKECAE